MSLAWRQLDSVIRKVYYKKRWRNLTDFCDLKHHPRFLSYKRYKRGKNRCLVCGAKLGKIKLVLKSSMDIMMDSFFNTSPLLSALLKKGKCIIPKGESIKVPIFYSSKRSNRVKS